MVFLLLVELLSQEGLLSRTGLLPNKVAGLVQGLCPQQGHAARLALQLRWECCLLCLSGPDLQFVTPAALP